jgi:hypothetical protein
LIFLIAFPGYYTTKDVALTVNQKH